MSKYRIVLNGTTYEMEVEKIDGNAAAKAAKETPDSKPALAVETVKATSAVAKPAASVSAAGGSVVKSPMPGTILKVYAAEGETVKNGQSVLVLEAMKMENEIVSPRDGKVTALYVEQGQSVQGNDALFEIGE